MNNLNYQLELLDKILSEETPESLHTELSKYEQVGPTIDEYLDFVALIKNNFTLLYKKLLDFAYHFCYNVYKLNK